MPPRNKKPVISASVASRKPRELSEKETRQALRDLRALVLHAEAIAKIRMAVPSHASELLADCAEEYMGPAGRRSIETVWDGLVDVMTLQEKMMSILERAGQRLQAVDDRLPNAIQRRSGITLSND